VKEFKAVVWLYFYASATVWGVRVCACIHACSGRVPTQKTEANLITFQHHKSQQKLTYSNIVCGLPTCQILYNSKKLFIELPVPIIDAKTS